MPRYRPLVAKIWQAVLLCVAGAIWAATAQADTAPAPGSVVVANAPNHITARLLTEGPAAPGGTVTLAIAMNPAPGWHGYWLNPGDAGYAMRLGWHLPAGGQAGTPQYPVPQTLVLAGLMNHVYTRDYAVLVPFDVPPSVAGPACRSASMPNGWPVPTRPAFPRRPRSPPRSASASPPPTRALTHGARRCPRLWAARRMSRQTPKPCASPSRCPPAWA